MPKDYAGGDPELYEKAIGDSISMFNGDGVMKPEAAENVLKVLAQFSRRWVRRRTRSTWPRRTRPSS